MVCQSFAVLHVVTGISTVGSSNTKHGCQQGGSCAVTCELACCSSTAALRGLSMLALGEAMLSLAFSSTADARRLTRRPWVMTCRRRSNVHRAARVLTLPLSAYVIATVFRLSAFCKCASVSFQP